MNDSKPVSLGITLLGTSFFFVFQYISALYRLTQTSGGMENKFSALAKDNYIGFLISENIQVMLAYILLIFCFSFILRPLLSLLLMRFEVISKSRLLGLTLISAFLLHGFFVLRLVETRPYFLSDAKFGYWYYEILNAIPEFAKPLFFFVIFNLLPWAVLVFAMAWHWQHAGKIVKRMYLLVLSLILFSYGWVSKTNFSSPPKQAHDNRPNVIIIGSDSLRGDRLGYSGYRPRRQDGAASEGVSPHIDKLAIDSFDLQNCYTPIASTLESGTSLMTSQYPHSHGFRHMYPNAKVLEYAKKNTEPLAALFSRNGYDTAAFGDWCAGYYELMPLGFEHISVSSFDNFKIYMSQAVMMAHFVIPLYFDHEIGYHIFPQLGSFAQFVTPEVVTERVKQRIRKVSKIRKPFFWHVFYSCNHLPYRTPEPYCSMFTEPDYKGKNRNGVDFDIDSFIGGTDLENKWKALPRQEIQQIRDLYDGCTRQFDDNFGKIYAELEEKKLLDNTIIIVTADHGDNLYEEGVTLGHGLTFNGGAKANHVPLLIHLPKIIGKRIKEKVSLLDIAPTLAELSGLSAEKTWQGHSFASWLRGAETPKTRAMYGETSFPFVQFGVPGIERPKLPPMDQMTYIDDSFNYQFVLRPEFEEPILEAKQRCLMTEKWKLICTPTADKRRHFALYSIDPHPFSESDVASDYPMILEPMKKALELWIDESKETSLQQIFPNGE